MSLIEAGYMVNDPHPSNFTADGLQHAGSKSILIAKGYKRGYELLRGIFEFDENCQEHPLVVLIAGE
jgi:hypothetical protein